MPTPGSINVTLGLNLEGRWPRSTYRALCAERGVAYDEADYLQWRAIGERLTREPCFETQVVRATAAIKQLGMSISSLAPHLRKFMESE